MKETVRGGIASNSEMIGDCAARSTVHMSWGEKNDWCPVPPPRPTQSVLLALGEVMTTFPAGPPLLDPVEDMHITDPTFATLMKVTTTALPCPHRPLSPPSPALSFATSSRPARLPVYSLPSVGHRSFSAWVLVVPRPHHPNFAFRHVFVWLPPTIFSPRTTP